jgi:hypothetical protein
MSADDPYAPPATPIEAPPGDAEPPLRWRRIAGGIVLLVGARIEFTNFTDALLTGESVAWFLAGPVAFAWTVVVFAWFLRPLAVRRPTHAVVLCVLAHLVSSALDSVLFGFHPVGALLSSGIVRNIAAATLAYALIAFLARNDAAKAGSFSTPGQ